MLEAIKLYREMDPDVVEALQQDAVSMAQEVNERLGREVVVAPKISSRLVIATIGLVNNNKSLISIIDTVDNDLVSAKANHKIPEATITAEDIYVGTLDKGMSSEVLMVHPGLAGRWNDRQLERIARGAARRAANGFVGSVQRTSRAFDVLAMQPGEKFQSGIDKSTDELGTLTRAGTRLASKHPVIALGKLQAERFKPVLYQEAA